MDRPLSEVFYGHYTTDPDALAVPVPPSPPLPAIIEPTNQPSVTLPLGAREPMVRVAHRRIRLLSCYWHEGFAAAQPDTWLRVGVAERLYRAADSLQPRFGFAIFDAWRPLELQRELYDMAYADPGLPAGVVSEPSSDPERPPPHLTGGTVDVTLTFDGVPLELGTSFDASVSDASTDAFEQTPGRVRGLRRYLYWTLHQAGFIVIDCEWWHFEHGTRRWGALTDHEKLYGPAAPPT